jgi:CheY-like chemotaxis protein
MTDAALLPARRILLVDDDPGVRRLIAICLRRGGFEVVETENSSAALRSWEQHAGAFGLLFTDLVMPGGMSGIELLQFIRELSPDLPVVLSSGFSDGFDRAALPSGVTFLPKPSGSAELLDTVQRAMAAAT